jgi:hypothetical protein
MQDKSDEIRVAQQDMDATLKRIRDAKAGKMNTGLEATYGQAYQRLVRAGAKPQLRLKYRG